MELMLLFLVPLGALPAKSFLSFGINARHICFYLATLIFHVTSMRRNKQMEKSNIQLEMSEFLTGRIKIDSF